VSKELGLHQKIGIVIPTLGTRPAYLNGLLISISKLSIPVKVVVVCPNIESLLLPEVPELNLNITKINDDGIGLAAAINKGFDYLNTPYWNWIGDDDEVVSEGLELILKYLEMNPHKSFGWGKCTYIDELSNSLATNKIGSFSSKIISFGPNFFPQPSCLFRSDITKQIGALDTSIKYAFDQDFIMRLLLLGPGAFISEISSKYRWHSDTLTSKNVFSSFIESFSIRMKYASKRGISILLLNIILLPFIFLVLQFSRAFFRLTSFVKNFLKIS